MANKRVVNKGDKFNDWIIIKEVPDKNGRKFLCENSNGVQREVRLCHLVTGASKGTFESPITHGMRHTRIYRSWNAMKDRCLNFNNKYYKHYGGRGIKVCDKWLKFEGFYEDMRDEYDDNLTIERIDVNGNYCKENCTWIPLNKQSQNRRKHLIVKYKGKSRKVCELAKELDINYHTLYYRLFIYNIPIEIAINPYRLHRRIKQISS